MPASSQDEYQRDSSPILELPSYPNVDDQTLQPIPYKLQDLWRTTLGITRRPDSTKFYYLTFLNRAITGGMEKPCWCRAFMARVLKVQSFVTAPLFCLILPFSLIFVGCAGGSPPKKTGSIQTPVPPTEKKPATFPVSGRVASVSDRENLCVIDFTGSHIPEEGSILHVLRDGKLVGTIKVSNLVRPPLVTADISTGSIQRGDKVQNDIR